MSKVGDGRWKASAPTRSDSNPSLSIRELPDGRLLMHDHGGDSSGDILAAIGLTLADLFPDRLTSPGERAAYRRRMSAVEALISIDRDALVVAVIAADIHRHRAIDDETFRRLVTCAARIGNARTTAQ